MPVPSRVKLVGRSTATILGPEPVLADEKSAIPAIERLICAHVPGASTILFGADDAATAREARRKDRTWSGLDDMIVIGTRAPHQAPCVGEWFQVVPED